MTEPTQTTYSKVIRLNFSNDKNITALFVNSTGLHVELGKLITGTANISITNTGGSVVYKRTLNQRTTTNKLSVVVSNLPAGQYFFRIILPDGKSEVQSFFKSN